MNRRFFLLIAISLANVYESRAQTGTIMGQVVDESALPIPGVHVLVVDDDRGTATDLDGRFRIGELEPGEYRLAVSAVGFVKEELAIEVPSTGEVEIRIELRDQIIESPEVVVTAVRRPQVTALVPVSVSLATHDELVARNIRSLDDALRLIPGVQMAENQVSIRGSSGFSYNVGSRVMLLVDGMPLLGPETGGIPFEALPMPQVAR